MAEHGCGCGCGPDTKEPAMEGKANAKAQVQLADLKIGQHAIIIGYDANNRRYLQRLLTMGLTRGTQIRLDRLAPMGDPVEIELRGYHLTLRKEEASILQLETVA